MQKWKEILFLYYFVKKLTKQKGYKEDGHMNIVILDANTLTLDNDIDFSVFNQYGDVTQTS